MADANLSLLCLGSGWTSTFLLPLLAQRHISFAYTTRSGQPRPELAAKGLPAPIPFQLPDGDNEDDDEAACTSLSSLPKARCVLIVFPLKSTKRVDRIVTAYEAKHGPTNWIALGSTGAWPDTGHFTSSSSINVDSPRATAEAHLLSYHNASLPRNVVILNLAGLYGGERQPRNFAKRVASDKAKLEGKGSLHLVHGKDVARVIVGVVGQLNGTGETSAWGRRWIVTDTHVYDWWHLFTTLQPPPVPDAVRWVEELCQEHHIDSLPRSAGDKAPLHLVRSLDGREIWRALGLEPEVGRCDEVEDDGSAKNAPALDLVPAVPALPDEVLDAEEEHELRRFERSDEFLALLAIFVGGPADEPLAKLCEILDEYQSHSFLLDPFLERIVQPPVWALQIAIRAAPVARDAAEVSRRQRLARLLYFVTKIRRHKMTTHFFPHAVEDLLPTLAALEHLASLTDSPDWELRYVLLLWLSLICMIPFDLRRFDEERGAVNTATRIERLAMGFLASPGKERDASAVLLGRLLQRKDIPTSRFAALLEDSAAKLRPENKPSPFLATGLLATICQVVKASDATAVVPCLAALIAIVETENPSKNGLVERYKSKLACRVGLKLLKPRRRRKAAHPRALDAASVEEPASDEDDEDDEDIPEELDRLIAKLLDALQDRDTTVRYSAAKGLSRLCSRLPTSFSDQVAAAVVGLFPVNVVDILGAREDLGAVSEHTWQGACMALAELGRRGLLSAQQLQEALPWVGKALLFDVRRGSSSVGSNVRDAACYVVWALARAHDADAVRPHALELAKRLAATACLDRDVSIRRAASAAFQEGCGRLNLFPHGIEVIRAADFYSVSNRSNAFLRCAPQVAALDPYRVHLLSHLRTRTIVHWDPAMRQLGAKSLAAIASIDGTNLVPKVVADVSPLCSSSDLAVLHGALLTLAEVGKVSGRAEIHVQLLSALSSVPRSVLKRLGTASVLEAACRVVSVAADAETAKSDAWVPFVDAAQSRPDEGCHSAAADALAAISRFADVSGRIESAISSWPSLSDSQKRSAVLSFGRLDYRPCPETFAHATSLLVDVATPGSPRYSPTVETRRNAVEALTDAVTTKPCPTLISTAITTALASLDDYTADQRGDVGSWVRLAAIRALPRLVQAARSLGMLEQTTLDACCAAILKQSVERIDGVRAEAGVRLLELCAGESPSVEGADVIRGVFNDASPAPFGDAAWLFPRAVRLLTIAPVRKELLRGLSLSLGSKTEMGHRIVAAALIDWLTEQEKDVRLAVHSALVQLATDRFSSSREFIPLMLTLAAILEGEGEGEGEAKDDEEETRILTRLLSLATRNAAAIKSPQRILACMKVLVVLVSRPPLRSIASPHLGLFLAHRMPTIRSATAEALYTLLAEEAPDSLIETAWSSLSLADAQAQAQTLADRIAATSG